MRSLTAVSLICWSKPHHPAPDQVAAVFHDQGIRWTYRDLHRMSLRLGAGLLALGVKKGDRVGIWSPNRWEWVAMQYASAQIGPFW